MEALRTIAALPEDDFQPADWASLMAARDVAIDEVAKHDRNEARKAAADEQRASRAKPKKARQWKPDPPELVEGKRQVRERSGGYCEIGSEVCDRLAVHVHHVARRKGKGCHDADSLLDVCRPCHDLAHRDVERAYREGWLRHAPALDAVYDTKQVLR